jgi:hypothetical protein
MYLPDELVTRDQRRRVGERLAPHIRTRLPRHADPALLTARACPLWDGRSYVYLEGSRNPVCGGASQRRGIIVTWFRWEASKIRQTRSAVVHRPHVN